MHQLRSLALAAAVLLLPTLAHADDASEAKGDLMGFASSVHDATKQGMFGNNNFFRAPAECTAAVKRGTDAGLEATDTWTGGDGQSVLWKRAADTCTQYAKLHALRQTIEAIQPQLQTVSAFYGPDGKPDKSVSGDAYRETVKVAKTCVDHIDKAIKAGVVADVAFAPNDNQNDKLITLTEARAICGDYIDWGETAAVADDSRQAEELAAVRAKWKKLGITGDRLQYLIENGHHIILGKGCSQLDEKGLKKSAVFYEVYSDDASWIVYKTQFKKDKKVKSSERRFRRDGGYSCK